MVSFLASILNTQCLPESLYPKLATPLATPIDTPTQTQASPVVYSAYPLRVHLLQFLLPTSSTLMGGAHIGGFVPVGFSQIPIASMKSINRYAYLSVCLSVTLCLFVSLSFLHACLWECVCGSSSSCSSYYVHVTAGIHEVFFVFIMPSCSQHTSCIVCSPAGGSYPEVLQFSSTLSSETVLHSKQV